MPSLNTLNRSWFILAIIAYIVALFLYGFWDNDYQKKEILKDVDTTLYNTAISLKYMLPDDFHDRAIDAQSISIDEDKYLANKLTSLVRETGIKYVYTIIKKEDKLFFVTSDLIENPKDERGTFYYYEYEGADENFSNAFEKKTPMYKTVSDQWGTVRTVMVPEKSPGGINYLACADYDISYVKSLLNKNLLKSIATMLFFLLLTIPIIKVYTNSYKKFLADTKKNEKKYRQIFNNIQDVYFESGLDGTILEVSPSIERYSQYKREELIGKSVYDVYTNSADNHKLIESIINKGTLKDYEINFTDKDGTRHLCSMNIEIVKDYKGTPTKVVGIFRDISDHKKAEDEKIKMQILAEKHKKLVLVGQVAGKMAHDFNNILGIIMGNTELTLLDCQKPETRETLELIVEQTIRGKNLTKNLVAFAKDQEPKQEFFRISEKIDLVLRLLRKDLEGIELIKEDKTGVPELFADSGMIEHALVNLIQNSIHALSLVKFPRIIVRTYSLDNKICFEIEDNGCGISKENLENIYEPSFTLKGSRDVTGSYKAGIKGTGYGMSNVKKYVEQHKGSISIESEAGAGTTFTICLPVIKKELTTQEKEELKKEIIQFEKHILLVEDEAAISGVQYRILTSEPCHHKVDIAHNGQMAKELFGRNIYDFVSLDYVLPGGINGMDVYHHIRKTNQTVPVMFISGNIEFLESIKELKQKDAYIYHLSKPCQNKDYVNRINELLEKTLSEQ
ncbi:PAS domain S-box protein [Desulforhopalus vacuolatus]|uniref:ATP-binding protein n=1 Tax=Desulforhopalus vacuolatus TaxID=40414 RepID=UPI0019642A7B|nr:ATP-binding protein [Desulforhopalus vacuolatus]MBM9518456.1 PAS domain S-box protein [Desulforhopalus vacuolatus]